MTEIISGTVETVDLDIAISRGLSYLQRHQFPNGEFAGYHAIDGDPAMQGTIFPDSNVFVAAVICYCITLIEDPVSSEIQERILNFLKEQVNPGGVYNYFTRFHYFRPLTPMDVDDTSCISSLFLVRGINWPFPSNIPLLLSNRHRSGLFYSWFTLRFKWVNNRTYWRLSLPELLRPVTTMNFWKTLEPARNDVDIAINANVLYYLGDIPETAPIIREMIRIILEEKEAVCDKWYQDTFFVYYFFSRNYFAGIKKLEPIARPIIERILAQAKPDGSLGGNVLNTAWAVCSLLNVGHTGPELLPAISYLVRSQEKLGHWPRWLAYYSINRKRQGYGSEELTTGFCLEAIIRYKKSFPL